MKIEKKKIFIIALTLVMLLASTPAVQATTVTRYTWDMSNITKTPITERSYLGSIREDTLGGGNQNWELIRGGGSTNSLIGGDSNYSNIPVNVPFFQWYTAYTTASYTMREDSRTGSRNYSGVGVVKSEKIDYFSEGFSPYGILRDMTYYTSNSGWNFFNANHNPSVYYARYIKGDAPLTRSKNDGNVWGRIYERSGGTETKGSLIKTVTSTNATAYPTNGKLECYWFSNRRRTQTTTYSIKYDTNLFQSSIPSGSTTSVTGTNGTSAGTLRLEVKAGVDRTKLIDLKVNGTTNTTYLDSLKTNGYVNIPITQNLDITGEVQTTVKLTLPTEIVSNQADNNNIEPGTTVKLNVKTGVNHRLIEGVKRNGTTLTSTEMSNLKSIGGYSFVINEDTNVTLGPVTTKPDAPRITSTIRVVDSDVEVLPKEDEGTITIINKTTGKTIGTAPVVKGNTRQLVPIIKTSLKLDDIIVATQTDKHGNVSDNSNEMSVTMYYSVWFDANGGEFSPGVTTRGTSGVYKEKLARALEPTRLGYVLKGWYTSSTGGTLYDFNKPIDATAEYSFTLYAQWEAKTYSLTLPLEIVSNQADNSKIPYGTNVVLKYASGVTAEQKEGIKAINITGSTSNIKTQLDSTGYTFTMTEDKTVTITRNKYYTVTLPKELTSNLSNPAKVLEGTSMTVKVADGVYPITITKVTANGTDVTDQVKSATGYTRTVNEDIVFAVTIDNKVNTDLPGSYNKNVGIGKTMNGTGTNKGVHEPNIEELDIRNKDNYVLDASKGTILMKDAIKDKEGFWVTSQQKEGIEIPEYGNKTIEFLKKQ